MKEPINALEIKALIWIATVVYFISGREHLSCGYRSYIDIVWMVDIAILLIKIALTLKKHEYESQLCRVVMMATLAEYVLALIVVLMTFFSIM